MNSNDVNKHKVGVHLNGVITANVYDRENNLVRSHSTTNTMTTNGLNRLVDMLIDGYNQTTPFKTPGYGGAYSTLHSQEFSRDGEVFGVNITEWEGKSKSTFLVSSNLTYITNRITDIDAMFNGDIHSSANFHSGQWNTYWSPDGEDNGWIIDLGYTEVTSEDWSSPDIVNYYNLDNMNIHFDSITLKDATETTTYTKDVDYVVLLGNGTTYGSIKLLNAGLTGQSLKVSYSWHDVPTVPIVGFAMDVTGNDTATWSHRNHFHAMRWSLNQGESRTAPFLPNRTGCPSRPGWESFYWDQPWVTGWHAEFAGYPFVTYFMNNLPWAVRNPTQLALFGQNEDADKFINNFDLLEFKMPKVGVHAIKLGSGAGSPSAGDTALFTPEIESITETKSRNGGTDTLKIKAIVGFDEGNGTTFTEAGLFFPSDDSVYFKEDYFWNESNANGGSGMHYDHILGTNKILKLSPLEAGDCDTMASHAMFDSSWSKTSDERIELVYDLNMVW